jgi:hypothetical protein
MKQMAKLVGALLVGAVVLLMFVANIDQEGWVMSRGREVIVHLGPRTFYNIDYRCCEGGVETVDVADWIFWRQSYKIKEIDGRLMIRLPDEVLNDGQAVPRWDLYEKIPEELRRYIDLARQEAQKRRGAT